MGSPAEDFATPRLAAAALFVRGDTVLLVHKTYGNGWDVPGGYVDRGESPATAVEREIREELGLAKTASRLLVHDWAPTDAEGDKVLYVFDCGQISGGDEAAIRLQAEELDRAEWVRAAALGSYVIPRLEMRLTAAFDAYGSGQTLYLEHGKPPLGTGSGLRYRCAYQRDASRSVAPRASFIHAVFCRDRLRSALMNAAPGSRADQVPVVRDAISGDIEQVLDVYSACIAADPGYLPFLAPSDHPAILAWFRLKPLLACLVLELDRRVVGVAWLRDAEPGSGAGEPGGRWLEACRLAVHPSHRGGAVTRNLVGARMSRAAALGADRMWMRCVEDSPSHRLAVSHGWTWWVRTEFDGPAAVQRAILLVRPALRVGHRERDSRADEG